jgi:hypothetical protein
VTRRVGRLLGTALLVLSAAPAASQTVPSLVLHHLRVGIDSATWQEFHDSPLLKRQFASSDSTVVEHGSRREAEWLLIGRRSWLELVRGSGPGSFRLGLTTEDAASAARVVAAWRRDGTSLDSGTVSRVTSGKAAPWYLHWTAPASPQAMFALELDAWHPALFQRLAAWDSLPPEMADRARALRPHYDATRLFAEVTGATIAIPADEIVAMRRVLRSGGVAMVDEGEGLIVVLEGGVRFRFVPAWERPGLRRLEFYLTQPVAANPTYRFGPRSRLQFGPGRTATWDFNLP